MSPPERPDREELTLWIAGELCPTGQSVGAMLEQIFLWCRDRSIYGPRERRETGEQDACACDPARNSGQLMVDAGDTLAGLAWQT